MQQLHLHHTEMLQGEFNLKKLNLLFAFQVNCPGCFMYGIPLVNKLYHTYGKRMEILGLSTAFEDFEFNNIENTKLLLRENIMVCETKKSLARDGHEKYPNSIDFPVAMDSLMDSSYPIEKVVTALVSKNQEFINYSKAEQDQILSKVHEYLNQSQEVSLTFTLNQFRGTPSFVLFGDDHRIIAHWFGHKSENEVFSLIDSLISNSDH